MKASEASWVSLLALTIMGSLGIASGAAIADEQTDLIERQKIVAEVERRQSSPAARAASMEAGLERSTLCGSCHGPDGNAKKAEYPNLAGQNPAYIAEQMAKFKDGRRKNFVMEALVRSFTLEDKINLALFFSSQQLKPVAGADPQRAQVGEKKYKEVCARCHGVDGRGEEGYARLAGQQIDYVVMNLKRFRANAQKTAEYQESVRTNAKMEQVAQFLSDKEIEGLAHYIALMK